MSDQDRQQKTLEAICKADYDHRIEINKRAENEKARRKKEADEAERLRRRAEAKGTPPKKNVKEPKDSSHGEEEQDQEIPVPKAGFNDAYGVWFFGQLTDIIKQIVKKRFQNERCDMMHVFIDVEPKKLPDGIHEIVVYGHSCRLYKWIAQGYHRGLVVMGDDDSGNEKARIYMESGTWSWQLNDKDKIRLAAITSGKSE